MQNIEQSVRTRPPQSRLLIEYLRTIYAVLGVGYTGTAFQKNSALGESPMAPMSPRRKVLIIEDEPSIRNVLYVLLAELGYDGDAAFDTRQALSMIGKEQFDAVLLDLRSSQLPPEQMVCAITELQPSLVGRVLVITGEVSDPATLEMLQQYALPHVPRSRVASDLSRSIAQMDGLTSFIFTPRQSNAYS